MRYLVTLILVMAALSVQARSLEFGPLMGYMSVEGRTRLTAFEATGKWLGPIEAKQVLKNLLPVTYSDEYVIKKAKDDTGGWNLSADEALILIARNELYKRQHPAGQ